ncbi:unnamed protein product [Ceutorhynchus assimilis]|uniref:CCHC-type domain-containing protein n=1 Tax=Ceutorhynchus assimilis TaxID=467358 RepID=A0A9N9MEH6_9CUCU|nr:unnamed protein product [Ceutorhynchus assimilis]
MDNFKKDLILTINENINKIKDSILQTINASIDGKFLGPQPKEIIPKPSYAEMLCPKQSRIVIRPKDSSQDNTRTKNDILNHIRPADENIQLSRVKHISDGGILLTADSSSVRRVKDIANEKLAEGYEIRELKSALPVVTIIGLTEDYSNEALEHHIRSQNKNIFNNLSELSVLKVWSTKNNADIFQANLQIDTVTFNSLKQHNRNVVGLDNCNIYDSTSITRCFKCNNFGHSLKYC